MPGSRLSLSASHSVIQPVCDPNDLQHCFDGAVVRNVEVTLYDNDGPGVLVTQIDPNTTHPDNQTTVLEGDSTTEVSDQYTIQLTSPVQAGKQVVVQINPSDTFVCLTNDTKSDGTPGTDSRFTASQSSIARLHGTDVSNDSPSSQWFMIQSRMYAMPNVS